MNNTDCWSCTILRCNTLGPCNTTQHNLTMPRLFVLTTLAVSLNIFYTFILKTINRNRCQRILLLSTALREPHSEHGRYENTSVATRFRHDYGNNFFIKLQLSWCSIKFKDAKRPREAFFRGRCAIRRTISRG